MDSGVETGNDSNDSIVATATAIGQQIAGSSITTVATIKQTDKQQQEEQQILQLQLLQQQHHHQVMQEHMQQVLLQQQQQQQQEAGPSIIRIGFSPAVWPVDLHFPIASSMYHMERYFTDGITALKMMVPDVPMYDSTEMSARRSCLRDNSKCFRFRFRSSCTSDNSDSCYRAVSRFEDGRRKRFCRFSLSPLYYTSLSFSFSFLSETMIGNLLFYVHLMQWILFLCSAAVRGDTEGCSVRVAIYRTNEECE